MRGTASPMTPAHPGCASDGPALGIGWRQPHYAELVERRPALDFIEVHSENFFAPGGAARAVLRAGRAHYPVSLHGVGLALGSACGIDEQHLAQLAALVAEIDPVRVSDHASFARGQLPGQAATVHASDLLPIPHTHEALAVLCANVQRVQERLQRPIAVENLSAYVHWPDPELTETELLRQLSLRTGCHLLVDVNNVYVNLRNAALQSGIATDSDTLLAQGRAWLDALVGSPVAELHLAGHADLGDIVIDDHGSRVCPEVWTLYRHAQQVYGPVPTLIEWDTDVPALDVLLDEAARARQHAAQARAAIPTPATPALLEPQP